MATSCAGSLPAMPTSTASKAKPTAPRKPASTACPASSSAAAPSSPARNRRNISPTPLRACPGAMRGCRPEQFNLAPRRRRWTICGSAFRTDLALLSPGRGIDGRTLLAGGHAFGLKGAVDVAVGTGRRSRLRSRYVVGFAGQGSKHQTFCFDPRCHAARDLDGLVGERRCHECRCKQAGNEKLLHFFRPHL